MPAIVTLNEHNTSTPGTRTDKTSGVVRCKTVDSASVDSNNPLSKPIAGYNRSYEKWLRLRIGSTGPGGQITNLQFYTSGSPGTGIAVYARTANPSSYSTPAIPSDDTAGTDATTFTTSARKSMGAGPYTATDTDIGDFCVLWMTVGTTVSVPQSPTPDLTLFFSYDEY